MKAVLYTAIMIVLASAATFARAEGVRPETPALRATDFEKLSKPPHPACRAWNDGCISCVSSDGRTASCTDINVPGVCTPHAIVCTREAERSRD